jgi:hypothetical protein
VPTLFEEFTREDVTTIAGRLLAMWRLLEEEGLARDVICRNSLIAPATCNLLNADNTATVDSAFKLLREVSQYVQGHSL